MHSESFAFEVDESERACISKRLSLIFFLNFRNDEFVYLVCQPYKNVISRLPGPARFAKDFIFELKLDSLATLAGDVRFFPTAKGKPK